MNNVRKEYKEYEAEIGDSKVRLVKPLEDLSSWRLMININGQELIFSIPADSGDLLIDLGAAITKAGQLIKDESLADHLR